MLSALLVKYDRAEIRIIPGPDNTEIPVARGTLVGIEWQGPVLVLHGEGTPSRFTIGLNMTLAPFIITDNEIQFDDGVGGHTILQRPSLTPTA